MNNRKNKIWSITAGIILGIVIIATIGLFIMVAQLDMLPEKYLIIAGLVVVFLLAIIFLCYYGWPFSLKKAKKNELNLEQNQSVNDADSAITGINVPTEQVVGTEKGVEIAATVENVTEHAGSRKSAAIKYLLRTVGVILSLALVTVDVMGMSMVYEFKKAISNMVGKEENTEDNTENNLSGKEEVDNSELDFDFGVDVEKPFVITEDPFLVYISGTDTRGSGLNNLRNDVNILAAVNPTTKQVLLINTPRDYYVEISVSEDGKRDKLTHCGIYGIDCSIDTLEHLYDQEIKYYTQINFKGFKRLVDAVGGVEVYSSKSFYTTEGNFKIKKGMNLLNGEMALAYVRDRYSYSDGDAARARNQMDVIKGIIKKLSSGVLLTKYADILDSMGKYFNCSLDEKEIASLVKMQLGDMAEWDVKSFAVTGTGAKKYTYSIPKQKAYVMVPDEASVEFAHELIDRIFAGEALSEEDLKYVPEKKPSSSDDTEKDTKTETEDSELETESQVDREINSTETESESGLLEAVSESEPTEVTIEDRN